jgi:hypothetical protein
MRCQTIDLSKISHAVGFVPCEVKVITSGGDCESLDLTLFQLLYPRERKNQVILPQGNHVADSFGQASNQGYPVGSYYASATTDHISTNLPDRSDGHYLLGSGVPS